MLTLVFGRAGSGKTIRVMNEIRDRTRSGETGLVLLVPEQYSHDAERKLCAVAGDSLSLHGEVLSFSRLASRVFAEVGGVSDRVLDGGGRILLMYRAVTMAAQSLRLYGAGDRRAEFLRELLSAADEFKSADITPERIAAASFLTRGALSDKLHDLSIILDTYNSLTGGGVIDPRDRLTRAAEALEGSAGLWLRRVYIDGFTDFTAQERLILTGLMRKNVDMTVCLTCDGLEGEEDIFSAARRAARMLISQAEERGIEIKTVALEEAGSGRAPELKFLERELFSAGSPEPECGSGAVELYFADTRSDECELAAARTLELLRSGMRMRDISVVTCDWETEGGLLESVFEKYGIPVYLNRKIDVLQKPPVALIISALSILASGWEYEDVFAYLKTGLTGMADRERDELENYVLKWNIRGSMWTREQPWTMPPTGYERGDAEENARAAARMDELRRRVAEPLVRLRGALRTAPDSGGHVRALYGFLEDIDLPRSLTAREEAFIAAGRGQLADEYGQLWSMLVGAMEQYDEIMGGEALSYTEFARLWKLMLSQYDMASIPVALDRVGIGDMTRHRRRDVRCLIILGAVDGAMPKTASRGGVLSDSERSELPALGLELPGSADEDMYRELYDVYSSITLPSERLIMCCPAEAASGRASYLFTRAAALLKKDIVWADMRRCRTAAATPCFELAVSGDRAAAGALLTHSEYAQPLKRAAAAASSGRGRLTPEAARALYGGRLRMSASRVDQYSSCRFAYFLRYGLKAKPRRQAGFDAPVYGTFMHYILENVTRDINERGGFEDADAAEVRQLVEHYVNLYVQRELGGFEDKSSRFRYLFQRLAAEAGDIAADMAAELRSSEFRPLDFELRFSPDGELPQIELAGGELSINGVVDRVDGWLHDGRLYLRVIDYKTGRKSFSLSDVWYGMGMQMLIYLFALSAEGAERYGREIVPAGVMYVPAREVTLNLPRGSTDEEIAKERAKALRRSGLILDDETVIAAMGQGEGKKYLPVSFAKDGAPTGDALASLERLGALSRHIDKTLTDVAEELAGGSIAADPYFKNQAENACTYCEFRQACHFSEDAGDSRRYLPRIKTPEVWNRMEGETNGEA